MRFSKAVGTILLFSSMTIFSGTCFAGFGFSYLGQKTEENSPSSVHTDSTTPSAPSTGDAPALQIFNDRYIPDSVRKKYSLGDNWYNDNGQNLPTPLQPQTQTLEIVPVGPAPNAKPIMGEGSVQEVKPVAVVDTWRARKGESLRDVLQRWSVRGNTNLMWASPDMPILQKDFSFVGKYQDAVNAIIKETGGNKIHSQYRSEGMNPVMMTPAATVTTSSPVVTEEMEDLSFEKNTNRFSKVFEPEKPQERSAETRWFGLSGTPLAEVIQVWADDANVKLIWQSEKDFALKESISHVGQFEDAVYRALSQYDREEIRPVGEIYHDPKTGERLLLVRTDVKS